MMNSVWANSLPIWRSSTIEVMEHISLSMTLRAIHFGKCGEVLVKLSYSMYRVTCSVPRLLMHSSWIHYSLME